MKTEKQQRESKAHDKAQKAEAEAAPVVNRKPKTKVLLVDDHPILRAGLRRLIDAETDMLVCGEAEEGPKAFELVGTLNPDIAVIDISLKGSNGIELIKNLKARYPNLPTLILSMHDESLYAERALRAGSLGYIMKEEAIEQVLTAIRKVLVGEIFLSEKMKAKMDLDTDIAIGLQGNTAGQKINAISYIGTVSDKQVSPAVPLNGTPVTLDATTSAPIAQLANARMAYMNSADGKFGDANTVGWEIELDRAALGVPNSGATATATINVFAIMSNGSGEYLSSDMILEIPGNNGANLNQSVNVDFTALMGTQAAAVKLSSVLATKNAEAAALSLSVYPNPVTGSSRITYRVLDRAENVNIILTDLTGRTVRVVESGTKAVGAQTAVISTADVAAGTYLVRVQVGARVATSKVVLL